MCFIFHPTELGICGTCCFLELECASLPSFTGHPSCLLFAALPPFPGADVSAPFPTASNNFVHAFTTVHATCCNCRPFILDYYCAWGFICSKWIPAEWVTENQKLTQSEWTGLEVMAPILEDSDPLFIIRLLTYSKTLRVLRPRTKCLCPETIIFQR